MWIEKRERTAGLDERKPEREGREVVEIVKLNMMMKDFIYGRKDTYLLHF